MILKLIQVFIRTAGINTSIFYFMDLAFERKKSKSATAVFWSMAAFNFALGFYIGYADITDSLLSIFSVTPVIIAMMFCYKERPIYKLIAFFVVTLICSVAAEFAVQTIIQIVFDGEPLDLSEVCLKTIVALIMMTVLVFFIYHFIAHVLKSIKLKQFHADKSLIYFILVLLSQYFLALNLNKLYTYYRKVFDEYCFYPFFIIGVILSLVSDVMLLRVVFDNCTANHNKLKVAELEYERRLSLNYYENISRNAEQIMKYKHDFNNILGTAYRLIRSEDETSKLQGMKMLDELFEKNRSASIPFYCKNTIINAIIYDKTKSAEDLALEFKTDLNVEEDINIELTDLCSIFTNLIDNAFNSAKGSKCKNAELKAWHDMGMLFVVSKNYPDVIPQLRKAKSGKKFTEKVLSDHGYGLDILNDIARKYEGTVKIKTDNSAFEVLVAVKV